MSRRAGLMMRSERNCRNWSGVQDVWPWVYRPTVVLKRGSAKRTDKSGTTRPTTSSFHLRYRKAASIGVSFRARTLHYARLSPKSGHPRPKPYPRQKKDPAGRQGREVHGAGDGTRTREYKLGKRELDCSPAKQDCLFEIIVPDETYDLAQRAKRACFRIGWRNPCFSRLHPAPIPSFGRLRNPCSFLK